MPPREIYRQGGCRKAGQAGFKERKRKGRKVLFLVEIYIIANFASVARAIFQKALYDKFFSH
jgi:hypothetical protein